jgi:hypothetical protein
MNRLTDAFSIQRFYCMCFVQRTHNNGSFVLMTYDITLPSIVYRYLFTLHLYGQVATDQTGNDTMNSCTLTGSVVQYLLQHNFFTIRKITVRNGTKSRGGALLIFLFWKKKFSTVMKMSEHEMHNTTFMRPCKPQLPTIP